MFTKDNSMFASKKGRHKSFFHYGESTPGVFSDVPLVILVNRNTASAAETLAGALQKLGLAVIVGEITFGKGIAQETFELSEEYKIKFTTKKIHFSDGSTAHVHGIKPDVEVDSSGKSDRVLSEGKKVLDKLIKKSEF